MEQMIAIFGAGALLGFAGSLHCACMCGGIASGALFVLKPETARERLVSVLSLQAGRITAYALAGGLVAGVTSITIDLGTANTGVRVLQWMSAVIVMWLGLKMAGMLPQPLLAAGGRGVSLAPLVEPLLAPLRRSPRLAPYAMGLSWGLTPCPLVYAALFSALLQGSFGHGALWMAGFGAGTVPAVAGAALGLSAVSRLKKGPAAETIAGLIIAGLGFSSIYFGWMPTGVVCATP